MIKSSIWPYWTVTPNEIWPISDLFLSCLSPTKPGTFHFWMSNLNPQISPDFIIEIWISRVENAWDLEILENLSSVLISLQRKLGMSNCSLFPISFYLPPPHDIHIPLFIVLGDLLVLAYACYKVFLFNLLIVYMHSVFSACILRANNTGGGDMCFMGKFNVSKQKIIHT